LRRKSVTYPPWSVCFGEQTASLNHTIFEQEWNDLEKYSVSDFELIAWRTNTDIDTEVRFLFVVGESSAVSSGKNWLSITVIHIRDCTDT